jgi:putative iron-dependent peroxidase
MARYISFHLAPEADPREALEAVRELPPDGTAVVGIGGGTVAACGGTVEELHELEPRTGNGFAVPVTPLALWVWLRGDDRGDLVHRTRALLRAVAPAYEPVQVLDAFQHRDSRDLTGYEDGTENPTGEEAVAAAVAPDGSSFVAVQQWMHELEYFDAMSQEERDHTIGRRRSDNEELDDAPASAHVKRTAQEDFDPPAFLLRRSMPWADEQSEGLVFVAFGCSLDAFTRQLRRMTGADDGIVDALFRFTRPVTGATAWCPPMNAAGDALDLSRLGL